MNQLKRLWEICNYKIVTNIYKWDIIINDNKKMREGYVRLILVVFCLALLIVSSISFAIYKVEKDKAEYYQEAMLLFCEIAEGQNDIIELIEPDFFEKYQVTELKDCEEYLLSYDVKGGRL